jgi:hypothetical protein
MSCDIFPSIYRSKRKSNISTRNLIFANMQQETRAVCLALMNGMGNLAQIYGAYLFLVEDVLKYLMGLLWCH